MSHKIIASDLYRFNNLCVCLYIKVSSSRVMLEVITRIVTRTISINNATAIYVARYRIRFAVYISGDESDEKLPRIEHKSGNFESGKVCGNFVSGSMWIRRNFACKRFLRRIRISKIQIGGQHRHCQNRYFVKSFAKICNLSDVVFAFFLEDIIRSTFNNFAVSKIRNRNLHEQHKVLGNLSAMHSSSKCKRSNPKQFTNAS